VKWGSGKSQFPLPLFGWAEKWKGFSLPVFQNGGPHKSENSSLPSRMGHWEMNKTVGLSLFSLVYSLLLSFTRPFPFRSRRKIQKPLSLSLSPVAGDQGSVGHNVCSPLPLPSLVTGEISQPPTLSLSRALRCRSDTSASLFGLLARIGAVLQRSIWPHPPFFRLVHRCPLRSD